MSFRRVASTEELWGGETIGVVQEGFKVFLCNVNGNIYAYEDRCAHQGVELSRGCLKGNVLICSAHEWEYDVCSGQGVNPKGAWLKALPVKVEGTDIWVDIEQG